MMTIYTVIPSADRDPESPVTPELVDALYNNPIAITEGASGAPSILYAALTLTGGLVASDKSDSVAGDIKIGGALGTIITNSNLNGGYIDGLQYFITPNDGEFRLTWNQRFNTITGGGETITVRIYRNGVNVGTSSSSNSASTSWFSRSIDISGWTNGDELSIWTSFAGGTANTAEIRNFYIKETTPIATAARMRNGT